MTIRQNSAEGGTDGVIAAGANASTPNTGSGSGDVFDVVTTAVSFAAVAALRGNLGYQSTAASTQYAAWNISGDTTVLAKSLFRFTSTPISNTPVRIQLGTSSVSLIVLSDGRPQLFWSGSGRATGTSSNAMAANTVYRIAVWCDTAAGSIRASIYQNSNNGLIWDTGVVSGLSSMAAPNQAQFGKYDSTAIGTQWDQVTLKTGSDAAYENTPYSDPLPTPVVTLGATVNPSAPGATDGKQTVSWPAVAGSSAYDARIATVTGTPSETDFTTVATGVTSPYQFTGLTAGVRWYGIKARI